MARCRRKGGAGLHLVVSDLDMPCRSGFDLVAAMRKSGGRLAEMPVIAPTGTVAPDASPKERFEAAVSTAEVPDPRELRAPLPLSWSGHLLLPRPVTLPRCLSRWPTFSGPPVDDR